MDEWWSEVWVKSCRLTVRKNKRFSSFFFFFFCKRTSNIHKFEGCFLRGEVTSKGFKVFSDCIVEPWILLVGLQKKNVESSVFRKRCDWTIFFQVYWFECPHSKIVAGQVSSVAALALTVVLLWIQGYKGLSYEKYHVKNAPRLLLRSWWLELPSL